MSKKKTIPYQNFSSFILRSPLFPFNFLDQVVSTPHTSEETLIEVCKIPAVQEAIFLATPDLYSQMQVWLKGELKDPKKVVRLHHGLMRYLLRMATRPTPFGLFAGFSIGKWAGESKVELPEQARYERHTRLDMNYLCALAQDLAQHPVIKEKLLYYPNSSLYPVGDQFRYVEYRYHNSRRTHHIVAVDQTDYLKNILDLASKGSTINELAQSLVDDEITIEEAAEFIEELIQSQVMVNQLEPAITGPEFLDQIMAVLETIDGIDDLKEVIKETQKALEEIDSSEIGTTAPNYHQIAESLKPLKTGYELKYLFQTDMVKPTIHCTLEQNIATEVLDGFNFLNHMNPRPSSNNLTQFKDAFYERYETMEVPLLEAMDTESGIGYRQTGHAGDIAPLVDDLALPGPQSSGIPSSEIRWNRIQALLLKKYQDALVEKKYEVEFTDKDVEGLEANWEDLPDTFSSMAKIVDSGSETNPSKKISVSGFGGSSAGNLLGRFCHADLATDAFVKEITEVEKELHPDAILAEIIHLPESRVGNVLLRPILRQYEIPYLAKAAVPPEGQIKVDDLMVSVKQSRIILRSKRLNKIVIPHLTNAHNYSYNALPVYQFLADLQTQNLRGGIGFSWGSIANDQPFLPRAVYKNIIISPAQWNIKKSDIEKLLKIKDDQELLEAVREWRKDLNMPAHVAQVDSDNKLYINLENSLCIRTLFSVIKKRPNFQLSEFLFHRDSAVVKNSKGDVFTNEFVLSFHKVKNTPEPKEGEGTEEA